MRENEAMAKINPPTDTCPGRESASAVLLGRADRLRRQAGELHQEADRIEHLGNWARSLQGHAEEALWRIAIDSIHTRVPRFT